MIDITKSTDEYYTSYSGIKAELDCHKKNLKNKIVYCNCDSRESNFYKYFKDNFKELELKQLIVTGLNSPNIIINADGTEEVHEDEFDLSYDSEISLKYLDKCDIVVTNPPFSSFTRYITLLLNSGKRFLIMGPGMNAMSYYDDIVNNKLWFRINKSTRAVEDLKWFRTPYKKLHNHKYHNKCINGELYICISQAIWFNTLTEFHPPFYFTDNTYEKLDNYDAILVPDRRLIPDDYEGWMAVSTGFISRVNFSQFDTMQVKDCRLNGKLLFPKLLIKRKD